MALTYTELVAKVRTWANRDEEVVSDAIIQDCLKYAADKAYRTLRVPPLENVATYEKTLLQAATTNASSTTNSMTEIQLPYDLVEFIQIRELDAGGLTTRVFNEKVDIRTLNDSNAEKYTGYNYWARQQNVLFLIPGFGNGNTGNTAEKIELYYYRRLPALNAAYAVTVLNYNAGFLTTTGAGVNDPLLYFTMTPLTMFPTGNMMMKDAEKAYLTQAEAIAAVTQTGSTGNINAQINSNVTNSTTITYNNATPNPPGSVTLTGQTLSGTGVVNNSTTGLPPKVVSIVNPGTVTVDTPQTLPSGRSITFSNTTADHYVGTLVPNWLRDENERVLLMGALAELFAYVQEDDQAQKYLQVFKSEIAELNDEDAKRNASGGNLQVNFNGRGLI